MLRNAMQDLADRIRLAQHERREFIAKTRRETERLLSTANRNRRKNARIAAREATQFANGLHEFHRNNQMVVQKQLKDTRYRRIATATQLQFDRKQETDRRQQQVCRDLRNHTYERKRAARQQARASAQTLRTVKLRVQQLRSSSRSLTNQVAMDLQAARRAWSSLNSL